jgi:hypothetical protein
MLTDVPQVTLVQPKQGFRKKDDARDAELDLKQFLEATAKGE